MVLDKSENIFGTWLLPKNIYKIRFRNGYEQKAGLIRCSANYAKMSDDSRDRVPKF